MPDAPWPDAIPCPCGQVHELSAEARPAYGDVTTGMPEELVVTTPAGSWLVARIYVTVHGIEADRMPELAYLYGFPRA